MPIEERLHILFKSLAELTPIALVLAMREQRRKEVDVLDVQLAAATGEHIATTVSERQLISDKTIPAVSASLPPLKTAVELSSRVIDDEALPSLVVSTIADRCFEVPAGVASERVRPEVEPYSEERRAPSV